MLMTGKVLRFDEVRGYGFIAPSEPGEDVFMHANDLLDEKYLYHEGSEVEFHMEMGEKGPKASQIRLVYQPSSHRLPSRPVFSDGSAAERPAAPSGEGTGTAGFRAELTEILVTSVDSLTAAQIRQVRERVVELAREKGWLTA
ncbi:cold shock domain-containing protein [Streptomyces sp. NPDC048106]|uniref:cold shock domain-containing protein n=1 Tax=Streptomyces sp. NPDC048106 TaxID=3155750 RepID=UPI0034548C6D